MYKELVDTAPLGMSAEDIEKAAHTAVYKQALVDNRINNYARVGASPFVVSETVLGSGSSDDDDEQFDLPSKTEAQNLVLEKPSNNFDKDVSDVLKVLDWLREFELDNHDKIKFLNKWNR